MHRLTKIAKMILWHRRVVVRRLILHVRVTIRHARGRTVGHHNLDWWGIHCVLLGLEVRR